MSSLKTRVTDEMKSAMRARDAARLSTIRMLLAAIKQREIDEQRELADADVIAVVDKMIKQRRDSVTQFAAGGRADLAAAERAEIEVLTAYMPQAMTESEIDAAIAEAIAGASASGPAAMGKVMADLKTRLAGRADLAAVSAKVRAKLAG